MDQPVTSQGAVAFPHFSGWGFHLTRRDCAILNFLWKWKLASTSTLHEVIGQGNSPYSTYKALERLEKLKYIEPVVHRRYCFRAWQLTDEGFDVLKEELGPLDQEGFLSESPWHDWNALAFQLGEWPALNLSVVSHFTEQELRRLPKKEYPEWVPYSEHRRSDGYTRIIGEKRPWLIAYEVELSAKSVERYESLIQYYRMNQELDRVYWLVGDPSIKEQIVTAKAKARDDEDNYHLFVDLAGYRKDGWDAPVTNARSETLFTIREHMGGLLGSHYGDLLGTYRGHSRVSVHYVPNKTLGKPRK